MGGLVTDLGTFAFKSPKQQIERTVKQVKEDAQHISNALLPKPPEIPVPPSADEIAQSFLKFQGGTPDEAATAQRKKSKGAGGLADDKLTGSKGLGEVAPENKERKVLLGY